MGEAGDAQHGVELAGLVSQELLAAQLGLLGRHRHLLEVLLSEEALYVLRAPLARLLLLVAATQPPEGHPPPLPLALYNFFLVRSSIVVLSVVVVLWWCSGLERGLVLK